MIRAASLGQWVNQQDYVCRYDVHLDPVLYTLDRQAGVRKDPLCGRGRITGLEATTSLIGIFMGSDFRAAHTPHLQFETQVDIATPFQRSL